ncbi:hypothetical protein B0H14DRAFT_3140567, partial [Mycena olivaceomarginata]
MATVKISGCRSPPTERLCLTRQNGYRLWSLPFSCLRSLARMVYWGDILMKIPFFFFVTDAFSGSTRRAFQEPKTLNSQQPYAIQKTFSRAARFTAYRRDIRDFKPIYFLARKGVTGAYHRSNPVADLHRRRSTQNTRSWAGCSDYPPGNLLTGATLSKMCTWSGPCARIFPLSAVRMSGPPPFYGSPENAGPQRFGKSSGVNLVNAALDLTADVKHNESQNQ